MKRATANINTIEYWNGVYRIEEREAILEERNYADKSYCIAAMISPVTSRF